MDTHEVLVKNPASFKLSKKNVHRLDVLKYPKAEVLHSEAVGEGMMLTSCISHSNRDSGQIRKTTPAEFFPFLTLTMPPARYVRATTDLS